MTDNITDPILNYTPGTRKTTCLKSSVYFLLCFLLPFTGYAFKGDDQPEGDEIVVTVEFKNIGSMDMPAIYANNEIFLSTTGVLDFLHIKNTVSPSFEWVKGFFQNERDTFFIDQSHNRISYKGKLNDIPAGLIRTETGLYMNLKYFKSVFGIDGVFYFRRLVVTLSTDYELPLMREMKQELMRRNLNKLKGDQKADTTIKMSRPLFHFGMADWAVMSSQQSQGGDQTTLNLGLGAVLAGGEANASINYYSQQDFNEKLQFYQWRYVNNDFAALRQVVAGKIYTQATSSLYAPVVGIQFTNAPTTNRSSYGTYRLSNTTEPNWIVELYVNEVLVDYMKADASGFYSFDVPLVYGYTAVKLRFYGPYGEVRTSQQYINIPFNFLPKNEFEYSLSGGIVEDNKDSRFSRVRTNYGLTRSITIGGGVEYLSSVTSGNTMPFLNTSVRLTQRMMLSGEYTYGVRSRGILSYRLPGGLQADIDYTKYNKGQTAIYYNYLEERKVVVSMPIHTKKLSLFTRLTVDEVVVPETKYTNTEWSIMGFYKKIGVNFSTYASIVKDKLPYLYSIASLTTPVPGKMLLTSQLQYDYKESKPVFVKFMLEKHIFTGGYFDLSFQDFFNTDNYNVLVGLRYDFSFSRVAFSALAGNNNTYSRVEAASGSIIYDRKSRYLNANNRSNVGKGGVAILPFLDLNCNGVKDAGEPRAPGLKVRINGGRVLYDEDDTVIRILDLEAYYKYFIELNRNSFDNIAWQIKNKTINVTASPNNITMIEVPVTVVGEVSGMVSIKAKGSDKPKGQGQISVCIFNHDSVQVAKVISESDGYFSYLGLQPGSYYVRLDSGQLHRLNYQSVPPSIPAIIKPNRDGDVADGLDFVLQHKDNEPGSETDKHDVATGDEQPATKAKDVPDTLLKSPATNSEPRKDTANEQQQHAEVIGKEGSYAILVDVYADIDKAGILKTKIMRAFRLPVSVVQDGEDYKVEIVGFSSRSAAKKYLPRLATWGFPEALIIRLKEQVTK